MQRLKLNISVAAAAIVASVYFLNDALTFALMASDPVTGRIKGCYTIIEQWLGYLEPGAYTRLVQLCLSAAFFIVGVVYLVMLLVKKGRAKSNAAAVA